MSLKFTIKGVHCKSCKALIEDIMEDINIEIITLELKGNEAYLTAKTNDPSKVIKAIESEGGYKVTLT